MSAAKPLPPFPVPFWDGYDVQSARLIVLKDAACLRFFKDDARLSYFKDIDDALKRMVPEPRTVLERTLDRFAATVKEKGWWWQKVHRPDVIERWRAEAAEQDVDSSIFDFALQQLRHQAGQCGEDGIRPSPVPGVYESDQALDRELRQGLLDALKPLEDCPDHAKDWHPGSGKQVLDVVHPSLFPLVYGLSRCTTSARPSPPRTVAVRPPESASRASPFPEDSSVGIDAGSIKRPVAAGVRQSPPPDTEQGLAVNSRHGTDGGIDVHADRDHEQPQPAADEPGDSQHTQAPAATAAGHMHAPAWHVPGFHRWKTEMGAGDILRALDAPTASDFVSDRFQWLPADILVNADGRVAFDSYINNVHPDRHAALYAATARLLERMLPLFERALAASTQRPQRVACIVEDREWWQPPLGPLWQGMKESGEAKELLAEWRAAAGEAQGAAEAEEEEDWQYIEDVYREEIEGVWRQRRVLTKPSLPETYEPPPPPPEVDLKCRRLQVIVKYAQIVLTPEQPEYGGGVWHVEGMKNEAIAASCIAYLAADNITESRLHFRSMVTDPFYAHYDDEGVKLVYGIEDEIRMNEPLGSALCVPGRMLCWPNALQHRVAPFNLADRSRSGVRKFAAVFLVDPNHRVISTRDVPPQQLKWHDAESRLGSMMPEEVKRKVDALREFPISLERAKELRLELMEERRTTVKNVNHEVYERRFSLCEH